MENKIKLIVLFVKNASLVECSLQHCFNHNLFKTGSENGDYLHFQSVGEPWWMPEKKLDFFLPHSQILPVCLCLSKKMGIDDDIRV